MSDISVGQLFMVGIKGTELSAEESEFLISNDIGGIILFDRNVESPQQVHKLCSDIQALRHKTASKAPFLISIDMEGGRVQRLKPPFTKWPAVGNFGKMDSTALAFKFTNSMGIELRSVGINLDFAPCVDLLTNPDNQVIGDRSVGSDPEHVGKMVSAFCRGYIKSGILPCAKHFPGHGNTIVDSHEDLPVEKVDLQTLQDRELIPFKKAFRARVEFCMTAHIKFESVDAEWPVTLSEKFLKDLLRADLRYSKIIISDDLDMKALRNNYEIDQIAVRALQAGCDMLLYCNEFDVPPQAIAAVNKAINDGVLNSDDIRESLGRVSAVKQRHLKEPDPPPMTEAAKLIGHPDHLKVAKAIQTGDIPEDLAT